MNLTKQGNRTKEKHLKELVGDGYFFSSQGLETTTTFVLFLKEKTLFRLFQPCQGYKRKVPGNKGDRYELWWTWNKVWTHR